MTDVIIRKRLPGISLSGEPIKADAWLNLHFLKDGRSWTGTVTFASAEEACKAAEEYRCEEFAIVDKLLSEGTEYYLIVDWVSPKIEYFYRDYSQARP
jgi:hypothetical protein